MKSKTSWFNTGISLNYLRRCWPLWAGYAALLVLVFPVEMADRVSRAYPHTRSLDSAVLEAGVSSGYLSIAFSVLAVMLMFSWLYSAKGSGMLCSLPLRRESLFVSCFLTGLVPMLIIDVLIVLLSAAVTAGSGYMSFGAHMQALSVILMMNFSFYCFAVFCAVLTGSILVMPAVFVVLNFTAAVAESCTRALLSYFVYGMYNSGGVLDAFSPLYYVLSNVHTAPIASGIKGEIIGHRLLGLPVLGIYCVAGLLLACAALLILKKRNMESASDVVAVPVLKPIFKYCLSAGCALVFAPAIYSEVLSHSFSGVKAALVLAALMLAGGFIGYVTAEMLIRKTVAVFKSCRWKGYLIFCLVCLVFVAAFEFDLFGFERYMPKAEDIERVELWQGDTVLEEPENLVSVLELQQQIIDGKAENEAVEGHPVYINYVLKDGRRIQRYYSLSSADIDDPTGILSRFQALCNLQEAIDRRCETELPVNAQTVHAFSISCWHYDENGSYTDEYITLDAAEAVRFYEEYLLPDIKAGTMGRFWFLNNQEHLETQANIRFEFNLSNASMLEDPEDYEKRIDEYFVFNLNLDAANCLRWLEENTDIEPMSLLEAGKNTVSTQSIKQPIY